MGEINSSLPLLGDKQLLSFLCLRISKTLSLGVRIRPIREVREWIPASSLCETLKVNKTLYYTLLLLLTISQGLIFNDRYFSMLSTLMRDLTLRGMSKSLLLHCVRPLRLIKPYIVPFYDF